MGLAHLPTKSFGGNAAWLILNTIAHNLTRWTARFGLDLTRVTTKTIRRKIYTVGGRLTRTGRRCTCTAPAPGPGQLPCSAPWTASAPCPPPPTDTPATTTDQDHGAHRADQRSDTAETLNHRPHQAHDLGLADSPITVIQAEAFRPATHAGSRRPVHVERANCAPLGVAAAPHASPRTGSPACQARTSGRPAPRAPSRPRRPARSGRRRPSCRSTGVEHLVAVHAQVVDAGQRDRTAPCGRSPRCSRRASGSPRPRRRPRASSGSGARSNAAREQIAVEHHVQVLVRRDPGQQLLAIGSPVALPVLRCEMRVASSWNATYAMECSTSRRGRWRSPPHVVHPGALQRDRVDRAGDQQVVADRDAVPALLGRPPVHPGAPRAVAAEQRRDLVVVAGRLSSVSRLTISAVRATSGSFGVVALPGLTAEQSVEVRPSLHGTYSWGNHSLASDRWRSRLAPPRAPAR